MKVLAIMQGVRVFQDEAGDIHEDARPKRIHYVADLSVDVDGAEKSYRLDNKRPPALDDIRASAGWNHGTWWNVLVRNSENPSMPYVDENGFCISKTSYLRPQFAETDRRRYVDPLTIPYSVLPGKIRELCNGVVLGARARITRTTDGAFVDTVYADSSGYNIGEAGILAAKRFGEQWNANNGDERKIYLYEFFPDEPPLFPDPITGEPFRLVPLNG